MTGKHTPGPWQVNYSDPRQVCDCDGELRGCAPIAFTVGTGAKENAALIAAAPDTAAERDKLREVNAALLSALEDVLTSEAGPSLNDRVRAAIAKAKAA